MMTSAAETPSPSWIPTGMPRPLSRTLTELSAWIFTLHLGRLAGERLVDAVVDDLVDHVVQARAVVGIADIHPRPLAHRLQALENLDGIGAVFLGGAGGFGHVVGGSCPVVPHSSRPRRGMSRLAGRFPPALKLLDRNRPPPPQPIPPAATCRPKRAPPASHGPTRKRASGAFPGPSPGAPARRARGAPPARTFPIRARPGWPRQRGRPPQGRPRSDLAPAKSDKAPKASLDHPIPPRHGLTPMTPALPVFLATAPGLEPRSPPRPRAPRPRRARRPCPAASPLAGGWPDVWRANLILRGATRVLVRLGSFRALHLAQLDKRARKFPWAETLRPDVPLRSTPPAAARNLPRRRRRPAHRTRHRRDPRRRRIASRTEDDARPAPLKVRIDDDLVHLSRRHLRRARSTSAATSRRSARRRCAKPWPRSSSAHAATPAPNRCSTRCAAPAPSSSRPPRSPPASPPAAPAPSPSSSLATFDPAAWAALRSPAAPRRTGRPLLRPRPRRRAPSA